MACDFDPAALTCKGAAADECLTPEEVETAKAIYLGPADRNGKPLFYGELPGSEAGVFNWGFLEAPGNAPGRARVRRPLQVGVRRQLGLAHVRRRTGHGQGRRRPRAGSQSAQRQATCQVPRPRRQADPVPGMGGPDRAGRSDRQLLQVARRQVRRRREDESNSPGCSWFPAWAIAASARARTGSTPPPSAACNRPSLDPEHDMFTALSHWVEDGVAPAQIIATKFVGGDAVQGSRNAAAALPVSAARLIQGRAATPTTRRISSAPSTRISWPSAG